MEVWSGGCGGVVMVAMVLVANLVIGKSRDMRSFEVFKINRRKSHFDVLNLKKNDLKMRNDEKNHVGDPHGYVSTLNISIDDSSFMTH